MTNPDPEAIENIVQRAKQGDAEAFSYLYQTYIGPLYRYVYFRVGDKAEAEDLVQDVFLKAYSSFSTYSYSGTSPLAFFYTIARNTVIDYHRKKKIPIADEDEVLDVVDEGKNPEQYAINAEDAHMLRRGIALLPEEQQDVVTLRFINGLSTSEIAKMLGKSEEAVRQLQSRGLRVLRKNIQKYE